MPDLITESFVPRTDPTWADLRVIYCRGIDPSLPPAEDAVVPPDTISVEDASTRHTMLTLTVGQARPLADALIRLAESVDGPQNRHRVVDAADFARQRAIEHQLRGIADMVAPTHPLRLGCGPRPLPLSVEDLHSVASAIKAGQEPAQDERVRSVIQAGVDEVSALRDQLRQVGVALGFEMPFDPATGLLKADVIARLDQMVGVLERLDEHLHPGPCKHPLDLRRMRDGLTQPRRAIPLKINRLGAHVDVDRGVSAAEAQEALTAANLGVRAGDLVGVRVVKHVEVVPIEATPDDAFCPACDEELDDEGGCPSPSCDGTVPEEMEETPICPACKEVLADDGKCDHVSCERYRYADVPF